MEPSIVHFRGVNPAGPASTGTPNKQAERGRTCMWLGCGTVLSVYNAEDLCFLHDRQAFESLEHGTRATYENHNCRCRPCKDANAERSRRQRDNRAYPDLDELHARIIASGKKVK